MPKQMSNVRDSKGSKSQKATIENNLTKEYCRQCQEEEPNCECKKRKTEKKK